MLKLKNKDKNSGTAVLSLTLNKDTPDLVAHFPGAVLVPAYMQLSWIEQAMILIDSSQHITEFKSVKFIKKIQPEGELEISLDLISLNGQGKFKIYREGALLTSGSFLLNE